MKMAFNITGAREMDRTFQRIAGAVTRDEMRAALYEGAGPIVETAIDLAPKKSGRLSGSIRASDSAEGATPAPGTRVTVYVGPGAEVTYAEKVETGEYHGDRVQPPEPFLRPAFDERADDAIGRIADRLSGTIAKAARG